MVKNGVISSSILLLISTKLGFLFVIGTPILNFLLLAPLVTVALLNSLRKSKRFLTLPDLFLSFFVILLVARALSSIFLITSLDHILKELTALIVIFLAIRIAKMDETTLRRTLLLVFYINVLIALIFVVYTLITGASWANDHSRLEVGGLGPGVIGSWGYAILALAFMCRDNTLIIMGAFFCIMIAMLTEMRTTGITCLIALIGLIYATYAKRYGKFLIGSFCLVVALCIYTFAYDIFTVVLMLNDAHRGMESGFSGRLFSWIGGYNAFLESPIIGVGAAESFSNKTYNGYLRVFSKFGSILGIFFVILLIRSILISLKNDKYYFALLISFSAYFIVVSKDFNLEIMPFLGFVAIFRSMLLKQN